MAYWYAPATEREVIRALPKHEADCLDLIVALAGEERPMGAYYGLMVESGRDGKQVPVLVEAFRRDLPMKFYGDREIEEQD